jgi:hypothetical protein
MGIAFGIPQMVIERSRQVQRESLMQAVLGIDADFRHCPRRKARFNSQELSGG